MRTTAAKTYRKDAYSAPTNRTTNLSEHYSVNLEADHFEKFKYTCAWLHPNGTGGLRFKMESGPQLSLENFSVESLTKLRDVLSHVIEHHDGFPYDKRINSVKVGV
jgi:hypothetical protein